MWTSERRAGAAGRQTWQARESVFDRGSELTSQRIDLTENAPVPTPREPDFGVTN
jgi:hypothetical protein